MVTYDARPSAFTQLTTTAEWEYLHSAIAGVTAIDASIGSAMVPSLDTGGRNAVIADGVVVIKGQLWRCDAPVSTPIPAASAQNRIDRLVIRLTRGASTSATVVQPVVITGTPSGTPAIPPLTQTSTGIWDVPVSHWTSTSAGALTTLVDDRRLTNDPWHDMRPLSNSFVGSISGWTPPQYRFGQGGIYVELAGHVQLPPTNGNYNSVSFFTLPPAYRPVSSAGTRIPVTGVLNQGSGVAAPCIQVHSDGTITMQFIGTNTSSTVVDIIGRFPLEDSLGFLQS
jgi:hypothetical protein